MGSKPKPKYYSFMQSSMMPNTYHKSIGPHSSSLEYLIMSKPSKPYLHKAGAKLVLEGFNSDNRVFYTGLIPIAASSNQFYMGNVKNKETGRKHLIAVKMAGYKVELYIYGHDLPTNARRKRMVIQEHKKGVYSDIAAFNRSNM